MGRSEEQPPESVGVVADGPATQRFAERLQRAGVAAQLVGPEALAQAQAGRLYLAPTGSAAAENAVRHGAHVCLIPPWPIGDLTVGAATVSVAEAAKRGAATCTTSFGEQEPGKPAQPLKILYRERLVGQFATTLVASDLGEPLLASAPRASNRHGYLFVTTLQLSVASAQTRVEDVKRLVEYLQRWLVAHAEPTPMAGPTPEADAGLSAIGEESAPLVALTLALLTRNASSGFPDAALAPVRVERARARTAFARVCGALGLTAEPLAFEQGWGWLAAHGVVAVIASDDDAVAVDVEALARYSSLWQLGPRLRRLARSSIDA